MNLKSTVDRKIEFLDSISNGNIPPDDLEYAVNNFNVVEEEFGETNRCGHYRTRWTTIEVFGRFFCIEWDEGLTDIDSDVFYSQPYEVFRGNSKLNISYKTKWLLGKPMYKNDEDEIYGSHKVTELIDGDNYLFSTNNKKFSYFYDHVNRYFYKIEKGTKKDDWSARRVSTDRNISNQNIFNRFLKAFDSNSGISDGFISFVLDLLEGSDDIKCVSKMVLGDTTISFIEFLLTSNRRFATICISNENTLNDKHKIRTYVGLNEIKE